jgi:hypothetical protein
MALVILLFGILYRGKSRSLRLVAQDIDVVLQVVAVLTELAVFA